MLAKYLPDVEVHSVDARPEAYPGTLTNAEAGERANLSHQSGTFSTYLSRLRTLELVTGRGGELKASDDLFASEGEGERSHG
jgi:hypothetical protein